MQPSLNVPNLFHVKPDPKRPVRPWPVVNRGGIIRHVQKILQPNHVTGIPSHWPKIYYGQSRENLNLNRVYRNTNAMTLPDGVYLYLIEYSPSTNRYYKSFARVHNLLESGSRHFQLTTPNQGRIILAAGELSKQGRTIKFNLESGTYTRNLMTKTKSYMTNTNYIRLVKNAFRNMNGNKNYVTNILIPKIPGNVKNLLTRGNLSFYHGVPTNKTKARVLAELNKSGVYKELLNAGLTPNSAANLVRKFVASKNSSPASASPSRKRKVSNRNGNNAPRPS